MKPYASYKPSGVAWLGDVPSHWASKRLKHIGQFRAGAGFPIEEQGQPDNPLPFFKVKDIDGSNQGGVITTADSTVSIETANRLGAKIFPKNSIVFAKVGAALLLNRFRLLGVDACVDNNMMGYMINADEAFPEFMYWAMQRINFSEIVNPGTVPSLNEPLISNLFMAIPPPDEQQAIADYLDAETARIDMLVQEKEELIGLLQEWRQSVIAEVVTKGLNKTVAMKPSGVPWLGEVPSHWSVEKLKFFVGFAGGGTPSKDNPAYWEGNIPWVSPKDMKRPRISETEDYITEVGQMNSPCTLIPPLSVLTVVRSGILQHSIPVALNMVPVTLNQDMKALLPSERVNSRFLAYEISGCQKELREAWVKQGATVESIEHQRMADSELALPPLQEQQAIADYLDEETAKIDDLIAHTHDEITLLKELRAATIADAVLGRVDVRTKN